MESVNAKACIWSTGAQSTKELRAEQEPKEQGALGELENLEHWRTRSTGELEALENQDHRRIRITGERGALENQEY